MGSHAAASCGTDQRDLQLGPDVDIVDTMKIGDSLEGDVGEQRRGGEDGGDPTTDVRDEGQNLVVLWVDVGRNPRNVLNRWRNRAFIDLQVQELVDQINTQMFQFLFKVNNIKTEHLAPSSGCLVHSG